MSIFEIVRFKFEKINIMNNSKMAFAVSKAITHSKCKLFAILCWPSMLPLVVTTTFMGIYAGSVRLANEYDDSLNNGCGDYSCFDLCGGTG